MTNRIIFANTLRGFAAVFVLLSHFAGIFWIMNPAISSLMGVPSPASLPELPYFIERFAEHCIIAGQFGVGIFFIISGLVIPFSLAPSQKLNFLRRRAWRIYPVYIAGFTIVMLALYVLAQYKNVSYRFSALDIISHYGIITRAPLDISRIDGVSWTLEVEIYFYLILCALGKRALNLDFKALALGILVIALIAAITFKVKSYLIGVQVSSGMLLALGMSYHALITKRITEKQMYALILLTATLITILWIYIAEPYQYTLQWMSGYLLAIIVFHTCYLYRHKFTNNKILSHMADISYPLYVVHALTGYAIMYVLVEQGANAITAIAAACLATYLLAVAIHQMIEKWSLKKSKPLARKLTLREDNA
ncbi:acyltransferase family protein [Pseudomonas parafulva]|uniref:acyltransferase family protein n=1 Tax=Pseudomonas TaxID=286 RepID=UPI000F77AB60|nr:acyltransferase [Pseudomonas putida]RSC29636.1 acyltransferase [Pseudomonas putida]